MELNVASQTCNHSSSDRESHTHIVAYNANLYHGGAGSSTTDHSFQDAEIAKKDCQGTVSACLFDMTAMHALGLNQMWQECQAYDRMHGTKLDKVENWLANECFEVDFDLKVANAEKVLFIDQVWLERGLRGQGNGWWMVQTLIRNLGLIDCETVVMLQAGGIGNEGVEDATGRLTRYWKQFGFAEWSYTDESWLCLDTADMVDSSGGAV